MAKAGNDVMETGDGIARREFRKQTLCSKRGNRWYPPQTLRRKIVVKLN